MSRKVLLHVLCSFTLLGLLAACAQTEDLTPEAGERNPFGVDIVGEDGTAVSLDGYGDGYSPGATETVRWGVQNNTGQPWNGRLCLQLLEPAPSIVVLPLAQEEFDLMSGSGFEREVHFDLPADLAPGTYGLALVIHNPTGPTTSVTTVHVGKGEQEPFQGQWPMEPPLEACPAP